MNLKRHEKDAPDVNLTPLIDVVFLLLIFFMVSSELKDQSAVKVNPPQASNKPMKIQVKKALTLFVQPSGHINLVIKRKKAGAKKWDVKTFDLANKSLKGRRSLEDLKKAIKKVTGGDLNTRIYIKADSKAPFQSFVLVYDALKNVGFKKINIVTSQFKGK